MQTAIDITVLVVSFLVVLTNAAVCVLVCMRKKLRTYTNGFVVSLAVSDILTGGVFMPINVLIPFHSASGFVTMLVIVSSTCNLSAVTFDRYLAVVKPLVYKIRVQSSFCRLICAVWGVAIFMTLLPLIWNADPSLLVHKIYLSCAVMLFLVLPLIFIFMVYSYIFVRLRRHGKLLRNLQATRTRLDEARKSRRESKTVKVFFSILSLFLISWLPVIFMTMAHIAERMDAFPMPLTLNISNFSITLSSLANPFLYTFMKLDFRQEVKAVLPCKRFKSKTHDPHGRRYTQESVRVTRTLIVLSGMDESRSES